MKKDKVLKLTNGWSSNLITKYNKQFKDFFIKLKNQLEFNDDVREILIHYTKNGSITKEDAKKLKEISKDTLKLVGLGSLIILPIPGSTLLMIFLINSAKKVGVDLIPSKFKNKEIEQNDNID